MSYTVHQAKTNLSRLIKEAEKGRDVVITRGKKPVAKLVPIDSAAKKRIPDMFKGELWSAPDAFDPLTDEELRDWGYE
ncbi:MAG TPA: type II toxin-antitoxin system prevent-host-death family antitoxin [Terriglobales bacterium]|nr:type II toxin-antitoxin system prevent-host-death family antitoxin [Terriglobales bacterium]